MAVTALDATQNLSYLLNLGDKSDTLVEAVDEGLDIAAFERVAVGLGIPEKRLADFLRIKVSTLARRKRAGRLSVDESERLYRLAFLLERSIQVMGTLDAARDWLKNPKRALGGESPVEFARTEPGAREVEDLLGRIEYGVPS